MGSPFYGTLLMRAGPVPFRLYWAGGPLPFRLNGRGARCPSALTEPSFTIAYYPEPRFRLLDFSISDPGRCDLKAPAPIDQAAVQALLRPFGQSRTLPAPAYRSQEIFDWESEHIFSGGWVCLGRTEDLLAPGPTPGPRPRVRNRSAGPRFRRERCTGSPTFADIAVIPWWRLVSRSTPV